MLSTRSRFRAEEGFSNIFEFMIFIPRKTLTQATTQEENVSWQRSCGRWIWVCRLTYRASLTPRAAMVTGACSEQESQQESRRGSTISCGQHHFSRASPRCSVKSLTNSHNPLCGAHQSSKRREAMLPSQRRRDADSAELRGSKPPGHCVHLHFVHERRGRITAQTHQRDSSHEDNGQPR